MKADAKFSRYSEREWCAIDAEVARVSSSADKIGLKERLERLARDYIAATTGPTLAEHVKFLDLKEKEVATFRTQVVDAGELPATLREKAREMVSEIERFYQDRAREFYREAEEAGMPLRLKRLYVDANNWHIRYVIPTPLNAHAAALDRYFESLLDVWMNIGGDWPGRSNTKAITAFIAACSRPVVGPKSTTLRAISERLYRLDHHRCSGYANET